MTDETLKDLLSPWLEERSQMRRPREVRRECRVEGCSTRLSRYNPGDVCSIHTQPDYRVPARR
jgi:hypothetical protein